MPRVCCISQSLLTSAPTIEMSFRNALLTLNHNFEHVIGIGCVQPEGFVRSS
jgi:hypothetical protein